MFLLLKTGDESTRYAMTSASDTDQLQLTEQEETTATMSNDPGVVTAQEDQQQQDLEGSGTLVGRPLSGCGRKSLKISIPLTTPSRTISALTDILWDELASQSSKKCNPDGGVAKQSINKTKLRHAEKMIKLAFVELYKGLGYLTTYR
jgi:hypothetical protein